MNKNNLFNSFSHPSLTPSPSPKGEGSITGLRGSFPSGRRLLMVLVALLGTISASAYDFSVENSDGIPIYYNITDANALTVEVTYQSTSGVVSTFGYEREVDLVVPSTVEYNDKIYTVTGIGTRAFATSKISSITLPNTIKTIRSRAFADAGNLSEITIPESVEEIEGGVICLLHGFFYCLTNIKKLYYNARHAVGNYAIGDYGSVAGLFLLDSNCEVIIGENVECLPDYFLYGPNTSKSLITSIIIPSNVTGIGKYAFKGCKKLTTVELSSQLSEIGEEAFNDCSALTTVIAHMTNPPVITSNTFSNRRNATLYVPAGTLPTYATADYWKEFKEIIEPNRIYFEDSNVEAICVQNWDSDSNGYLDQLEAFMITDLGTAFQGNNQITKFNELQYFTGLTSIPDNAFNGCISLTAITLPEQVTDIGESAFAGCVSLQAFDFTRIKTVGASAFQNCSRLTTLTNLTNVTTIDEGAFAGCIKLASLTISATTIGNGALAGCTSLTTVSFNATAVESNTFQGCTNLNSVTLGSRVTDIKEGAFRNCTSLTTINIPGTVITISGGFEGCTALSNVTLNPGTKYIVNGVFTGCSSLKNISLPNGLAYIGQNVFAGTGINTIDIPSSVTNIMSGAFANCTSLKIVTVNWTTPLTVPADAFPDRASQVLQVPDGTKTLYQAANVWKDFNLIAEPGDVLDFPYAIYNATAHSLTFYNDGQALSKSGMLLFMPGDGEMPEWYNYRSNITTVTFDASFATVRPTSTTKWFNAFTQLTTINGLTNLNTSEVTDMQQMFDGCTRLKSLDLSGFNTAKVTNMSRMFRMCSTLTTLDLSTFSTAGLASNENCMIQMFQDCSNLKTILVDEGWVTPDILYCGYEMFKGCTNLVGGYGTTYDAISVGEEKAYIDRYEKRGYFTDAAVMRSPYATLSSDGHTMTFLADGKRLLHTETTYNALTAPNNEWDYSVAVNITKVVFDPSFASARPTCTEGWFASMKNLTTITGLEYLNTSEVKYMAQMFYGCESLTSLDLSHFDTSKVIEMYNLFEDCRSLTSLDLSHFNTANVEYMNHMFEGCSSLTTLDLSSFNTSKVKDMEAMFADCSSLTTIFVSDGSDGWNTSSVTAAYGFDYMFQNCTNIMGGMGTTYDSVYIGEDAAHIDQGDEYPGYLTDVRFLTDPYAVLSSDGKTLTFYHDGKRVDRRTMKTYSLDWPASDEPYWFSDDSHYDITHAVFDASFADVRPTNTYYWFGEMENLLTITGLEYLNTSEVTNMNGMFMDCCSLTSLDVSHFDTKKVTTMRGLFAGCSEVPSLDVSHFDTRNVTNMADMFSSCSSLTALDIRNFDTQKVTDMYAMFWDCQELTSLDVRFLNTAKVENMGYMFGGCEKLVSLDVSNFNTAKVKKMEYMFYGCKVLTSLDLTSFNTANVTNMGYMFCNSSALRTIVVGDGWSTGLVTQSNYMFTGCTSLVGGAGTVFASNHVDAEYAHLDGGLDNPGYLSKYDVGLTVGGVTVNLTNMADILGDGTVSYDPATLTLMLNNASIVMESGHAIETTAGYSGSQLIIELLGQNYIDSGDDYEADIVLSTNTFIKGPGELTLEDNSSSAIWINGSHSLFITNGCTIRARFISAPGFYTGSDTGILIVTGADTRIILRAGDETEANIYGFNDVILDEDSGLQFTYPAGAWYDNENEYCVMCDEGEAYGVTIECPPYVVYDSSTTTLTFYHDRQRSTHNGTTETTYDLNAGENAPGWISDDSYANVTTVVFDESFAQARPTTTASWFAGMTNLTTITGIENLNTSEVTSMRSMFFSCSSLKDLDVSHFDTQNVTSMRTVFYNCSGLTSIDVSHFDTRNVTIMRSMFSGCSSLTSLNVSNFDTRNVTDMSSMFLACSSLTSLDVSSFNTSNVTDMSYLFQGCSNLTTFDLSHFNTQNVTNMSFMFYRCTGLTNVNLSNFNTQSVTTLSYMFGACPSLTTLDLGSFNTATVTYMSYMFVNCSNLKTIYVGDGWSTEGLTGANSSTNMFAACTSIVGGKGTVYDSSHWDKEYARIDGGPGSETPGYLTEKPDILLGDVNGDGDVNVADVTALVNIVNNVQIENGQWIIENADVDGSGEVTSDDVPALVNKILGK